MGRVGSGKSDPPSILIPISRIDRYSLKQHVLRNRVWFLSRVAAAHNELIAMQVVNDEYSLAIIAVDDAVKYQTSFLAVRLLYRFETP